MTNIFYNGTYWFYLEQGEEVVIPLPGDVVIKDGMNMFLISDVSVDEETDNLEVFTFEGHTFSIGRNGKKTKVMSIKPLEYSLDNLRTYKIIRGSETLYPVSLKFKLLNKLFRLKKYLLSFFKKN